jgi:hypothetical protein
MYSRFNIGTMPKNMGDRRQTGARAAHEDHSPESLMWELRTLWNEYDLRKAIAQDPDCIW